jgi:Zn-dependent protease/predicted transcriptional regulator
MPTDLPNREPEDRPSAPSRKAISRSGADSGAYRLITIAGIPLRLHWTFLLLLVLALAVDGLSGATARRGLGAYNGVFMLLSVFGCVTLHEFGHALVARAYGVRTREIILLPFGGVASLETMPKPRQELWIALAGPAVNVAIAAVLYVLLRLFGQTVEIGVFYLNPKLSFFNQLLNINLTLVAFNLIPAFPMDGGRVLRSLLARTMEEDTATQIAATIGQGAAILLGIFGIMLPSWGLVFIAVMVYFGAGQEASAYRAKTLVTGHRVREAMMRDFRTLTVGQTLREAAQALLDGSQQDFPVVHGSEVVGMLSRSALLQGIAQEGPDTYVAGTMAREFATVGPDEDLESVMMYIQQTGPILVLADESYSVASLLGILTQENLLEFLMLTQLERRNS